MMTHIPTTASSSLFGSLKKIPDKPVHADLQLAIHTQLMFSLPHIFQEHEKVKQNRL